MENLLETMFGRMGARVKVRETVGRRDRAGIDIRSDTFVCGRVWHPDHKTVVLDGWHRVLMSTENLAPGAREVVFLD